jgi:hypothetical protein
MRFAPAPCRRGVPGGGTQWFLRAAVLAGLAAAAVPVGAGGSTSTLTVSATILPFTRLEAVSAPRTVTIGLQDVERGWVDVDTPVQVSVTSNHPRGALLLVAPTSEYIERTDVSGLGRVVLVGRNGGFVALPGSGAGRQRTDHLLRFRLFLAKATPPGTHAWPIQLSAQLL